MKERFVHEYDVLICDHHGHNRQGKDPNFKVPDDRHLRTENYRVVTDADLGKVRLGKCTQKSNPCVSVGKVLHGLSRDVKIKGHRPLLVSLRVVTLDAKGQPSGFGHIVTSFEERLIVNEGWTRRMQKTDGNPTVGVGFNMNRSGAAAAFNKALGQKNNDLFDKIYKGDPSVELTDDQVQRLFDQDLQTYTTDAAADGAKNLSNYGSLTDEQRSALAEMFYTGNPLKPNWPMMAAALRKGDFQQAAYQLLHNGKGGTSVFASDPNQNPNAVGPGRANSIAAALKGEVLGWPDADPKG